MTKTTQARSSKSIAEQLVGNAIQDAVRNAGRQAEGETLWTYASAQQLMDARLAEIGMTGSFDIDLPDGRHFRVDVHQVQ